MNDRIRELAAQAEQATKEHFNFDWDGTPRELFDMYFNEKFAHLIVWECAGIYHKISNGNSHMGTDDYIEALNKTFWSLEMSDD